jgi:hypothetical protein
MGGIDRSDRVRYQYAVTRRTAQPPDMSGDGRGSPYALIFRDAANAEVGRQPFAVNFDQPHEHPHVLPIFLDVPLPAGASRYELAHGDRELYGGRLDGERPQVFGVRLRRTRTGVRLAWRASDRASAGLRYALRYAPRRGMAVLLASGLKSRHYEVPTRFLAATRHARIIVEASDGALPAHASSRSFSVARSAPATAIVSPGPRTTSLRSPGAPSSGMSTAALVDEASSCSCASGAGSTPSRSAPAGGQDRQRRFDTVSASADGVAGEAPRGKAVRAKHAPPAGRFRFAGAPIAR